MPKSATLAKKWQYKFEKADERVGTVDVGPIKAISQMMIAAE